MNGKGQAQPPDANKILEEIFDKEFVLFDIDETDFKQEFAVFREAAKMADRESLEVAYAWEKSKADLFGAVLNALDTHTRQTSEALRKEIMAFGTFAERTRKGRRDGGHNRHSAHQEIKIKAYALWKEWQAGKAPEIGTSQAAFGRFVSRNITVEDEAVTERQVATVWCPEWRKMRSAS